MISRRKQILDAIVARFETIAVGVEFVVNGEIYTCLSDIGETVFLRRVSPLDESEAKALTVNDGPAPARPVAGGYTEYDMSVQIACLYRDDDGTKAENACRDTLSAIGSDPYWGGLAENTSLESADRDIQIFEDHEAGFDIPLKIKYQVPNWTI